MKPKNFRSLTDSARKVMLGESVEEKPDQQPVVNELWGPLHGINPAMFLIPKGEEQYQPVFQDIAPGVKYNPETGTYWIWDPENKEWLDIFDGPGPDPDERPVRKPKTVIVDPNPRIGFDGRPVYNRAPSR